MEAGIVLQPQPLEIQEAQTCDKCGKVFDSKHGLSMHKARMHKRNGYGKNKNKTVPLDADKLLAIVFPNGIPANTTVLREVNSWLVDTTKLHKKGN